MKIPFIGGPADGREYEWNGEHRRLMVPVSDWRGAVYTPPGAPLVMFDPEDEFDTPYYPCADGKYRPTSFRQAEYVIDRTGPTLVFRYVGRKAQTRKIYDPAVKAFVVEEVSGEIAPCA